MRNQPKISVILPVYNCELYIKEAIDSILNQTFSNFELLIIDDKSTDKTVEIIKSYTDDRINLTIKEKNSGYTDSLNWAISIAKGIYIARMDGDDISMPTRFEEQIKIMEANPKIIVCGTNGKVLGTDILMIRPEKHNDIFLNMFTGNTMIHPSVMMQKKVFTTIKYDKTKEPSEDYDLWSRLIFEGEFYNIQKILIEYRRHNQNISKINISKNNKHNIESKIKFYEKFGFNFANFPDKLIENHIIYNEELKPNDYKELLNLFKNKKLSTKIKNHLMKFIITKFLSQNSLPHNLKYICRMSLFQNKILFYYYRSKFKKQ